MMKKGGEYKWMVLPLFFCLLFLAEGAFAARKPFKPSHFFSQRGNIWESVNKVVGEFGMQFYLVSTVEEQYTAIGTIESTFRVTSQNRIDQEVVSKFCESMLKSLKISLLDTDCRKIRWLPSGVVYRGDLNLGNVIFSVSEMKPDSFTFLVMIYEWLPN